MADLWMGDLHSKIVPTQFSPFYPWARGRERGGGDDNRRVKRSNYFLEENTRERRMRTPSGRIRTSQQKLALEVD